MRYFFLACLFWLLLSSPSPEPAHIDTAKAYIGTVENDNNSGPLVEKFLASVHLKAGNPWCAAFVSYCLDAARVKSPKIRSARATAFIMNGSIPAGKVARGVKVPVGSIIVWRRGSGVLGHVGFVEKFVSAKEIHTIEGNTSPGDSGKQFNGDGVYERVRKITPANYFRIVSFTKVRDK